MGFEKGNKFGGQRIGFAKMIDKLCVGGNPEELFEFAFKIMRNEVQDPLSADPKAKLFIPIQTRWDANKWLLERRFGKATQNVDVTSHKGLPERIDFARFTDAQLAEIERLHEIGNVVDGEFTEGLASLPEGEKTK